MLELCYKFLSQNISFLFNKKLDRIKIYVIRHKVNKNLTCWKDYVSIFV